MTRHYFRSIRKDAKRKRLARFNKLYGEYSKAYDKLRNDYEGAAVDKWSKTEFAAYLDVAKRKMTTSRFINRSVSLQIGVMPRSEAINLRMQLANAARAAGDEEYAAKVSEMSIQDVRNNPVLQKTLYNYLKKSGMNPEESSAWWTENIIGSD